MSMVDKSAEDFARRAFDLNLLDQRELESVWAEFGTRTVPAADLQRVLVRRGLLTNYQVDKLARGDKSGFFYGDYKVLYLVGSGSFARVYRAVSTESNKVVAVKVLRKRFSKDPAMTEQFVREGEMGAKLRHPNIVPIYEVHSAREMHYMVMDFIEGRNLREFVRVRKKLAADEAIKFSIDIAAGLAYAAEHGIRHRDLKLSNVLMSSTGRAQLVDFGLAAVTGGIDDDFSSDTVNPRTIDYAGLERATGVRKDDPRSDVYFAGCILYHMLTGRAPLVETKDRTQRLSKTRFESITPIAELEPELPQRVVMVVNKAMELNVNRRYQSPGEFLADLRLTHKRLQNDNGDASLLEEGNDKAVMIIDSNPSLQDTFREQLKRVGYRVLVLSDPSRAIDRCDTDERVADCVVFGCHSLGEKGLAAFNRFGELERTRAIPAILLIAEKQRAFVNKARLDEHRIVAKMPLRMREFRGVLKKLIGSAAHGHAP